MKIQCLQIQKNLSFQINSGTACPLGGPKWLPKVPSLVGHQIIIPSHGQPSRKWIGGGGGNRVSMASFCDTLSIIKLSMFERSIIMG